MSLAINTTTPDGLVLSTDSRQSYRNRKGMARIGSDNASKLFQFNKRIGVAITGIAFLPEEGVPKNISKFIEQFKRDTNTEKLDVKEAAQKFGSQCIVLAIDAKKNEKMPSSYEVVIYGGRKGTGKDAVEWAKQGEKLGAGEILLTSMERDGTKLGFDLPITKKISESVNIPVIASGGVGELKHFVEAFKEGKADAALAASIFHYKEYTVKDIKNFLKEKGIVVRE